MLQAPPKHYLALLEEPNSTPGSVKRARLQWERLDARKRGIAAGMGEIDDLERHLMEVRATAVARRIRSPLPLFIVEAVRLNRQRRSLKFDDITFRIRDIDGRTLPFSAVARLHRAHGYSMRLKFATNGELVERFYSKAKVIKISPFNAWRRAASTSQLAVDWHKVNQGSARPQLHQTY